MTVARRELLILVSKEKTLATEHILKLLCHPVMAHLCFTNSDSIRYPPSFKLPPLFIINQIITP